MLSKQRPRRLDYWRDPACDVIVEVTVWQEVCPIKTQYIERPRSLRMVWNYLRRVGPVQVIRKIKSRWSEKSRNEKVAALGQGIVIRPPEKSSLEVGETVLFFAPNHPRDRKVISIDERFVTRGQLRSQAALPDELEGYIGWSKYAGVEVDTGSVGSALRRLTEEVPGNGDRRAQHYDWTERYNHPGEGRSGDRKSAVLFGLGNYAKTQIIPHIKKRLRLVCIHEVDPDQLRAASGWDVSLDTCPEPRPGESYDAWFIAGFHHTHAPLARHALLEGAYAVVEKPLATNWEQYNELRSALAQVGGRRLFACFQKRYSPFNSYLRRDLGVDQGEPVDMHAIVYEIPLPMLHWYNWPNSGSRLVSNGCHWLDYFMFVNGYPSVTEADVLQGRGADLVVFVRLANDATLFMSLTDTGSERLGVRDLIEFRATNVTVRIVDGALYEAENSTKPLRRKRVNPMVAYRNMYSDICRRIAAGEGGDEPETLRSTELMLRLEERLKEKRVMRR